MLLKKHVPWRWVAAEAVIPAGDAVTSWINSTEPLPGGWN